MDKITRRGFLGFVFLVVSGLAVLHVPLPEAGQIKTITVTLVLELGKRASRTFLLHIPSHYTVFDATTRAAGLLVTVSGEEKTRRFIPQIELAYNLYYRVNGKDVLEEVGVDHPLKDGDTIIWSAA